VSSKSPAACPGTSDYCPSNASKSEVGPYNLWTGFGNSVNTFFVPLEEQVGAQNAVAMAKNLGINFRGDPNVQDTDANLAAHSQSWGAFTLGVASVSPLEMANAYATVAADGIYCDPTPVSEIHDFNGAKLSAGDPRCKQAVDPDVARAATDAARCPVGDQSYYGECHGSTASPTRSIVPGKYQIAGKTGTTDDDRTAALIAMTKQLAIAGIVADPDNSLTHGYSHNQVNYAVQHTLADGMAGKNPVAFTKESDHLAYGQRVGAWFIDFVIQLAITTVAGWYWLSQFVTWYTSWFTQIMNEAEGGGSPTFDQAQMSDQITGYVLPISLISFAVTIIYQVAFLTWRGATPGKMAVGISVRLRDTPGNPTFLFALKRHTIYVGTSLLSLVPGIGASSVIIKILNLLWPLWDDKRQALHDKIAKTNVVVKRRGR